MSAVPKKNKRNRQPASQGPARHSGEKRVAQIGQWESTTTGSLCEFITSGSRDWKSYYSDTGAYFIRTQDINRDHLDLSNAARVKLPDRVEGKRSRVLPGDLLITITGANVGKVALVPDPIEEAYVSQSVGLMRLKDKRFAPYLHYYLQSEECGRKQVLGLVYGIGRPVLSLQNLRDIPVVLPPLEAQRKIIAEIEKQSTRLDAGVAALRRVQGNLKRYRAAVLKAACEGRLVPTEAELAKAEGRAYETGEQLLARILADRHKNWRGRGKYKEPVAPDTTDLPRLPEGWVWGTAEQLTSLITDGEHITPRRTASGVYLLSARNVLDGRISLETVDYVPQDEYERIARRLIIESGDVLLSCSGSVGRSTIVPEGLTFTLVRSVAVLKPMLSLGRYLSLALRSPLLRSQISARQTQTAQANIFQGKIKALCFPLPSLSEQARIVAEVERRLSVIEELEATIAANLQRATRLRKSILQRAFTTRQ